MPSLIIMTYLNFYVVACLSIDKGMKTSQSASLSKSPNPWPDSC